VPHPGRLQPRRRGRWTWWLAAAAVLAAMWIVSAVDAPPEAPPRPSGVARAASGTEPRAASAAPVRAPFSAAGLQARQAQRSLWRQRLERAQATLDAYRQSTRYPPESQPLAAHPDQAYPNESIGEEHPLGTADGKPAEGVSLHTTQERVFVQGGESVRFTVSLRDNAGQALPLRVLHASAREMPPPHSGSMYPEVPLAFNDDGNAGDALAGDGVFSVQLQPDVQGFAGLFGQIRVEAALQYRDQQGRTYFDILYTPAAPATWQGGVREAMQDGSLDFYLKANVREPGRYVVTGRVDDANGTPFALLSFNEEVSSGAQEFRLTLFGKLVRDAKPVFPLTVRDVNAFLLHPDTFPDRSLMPRLQGMVHVSESYPLASFSDAEWNAEQRNRYLNELGRDVADAQARLERLGPGR
jgi:hypothetical protein